MADEDLDLLDPDALQLELLGRINSANNTIRVNSQVMTIPKPSSVVETPQPSFDTLEQDNPQIYQSTIVKDIGGVNVLIDAAYAYQPSGKVLIFAESDDHDTNSSRDPIFTQSLLHYALESIEVGEETERVLVKDLPIFLNSLGQYIPLRTVDALVGYGANYLSSPDESFKLSLVRAIVDIASQYDYFIIDDSWNIGTHVYEYIEEHPGVVRCVVRP